ncbi:hypothetical protein BCR34DRAFT_130322 [Clohesyomyces aquaticus]|uniref:Uncharacterized protein n=1 Tax=Clohesyomyces aquaticus TaxID=1231657 RepID=A0A1Y2AAD4_9PLEO|nr:hypothetical protein BCR34DRAFT_130322 [Clohesyomyces aquaticus]
MRIFYAARVSIGLTGQAILNNYPSPQKSGGNPLTLGQMKTGSESRRTCCPWCREPHSPRAPEQSLDKASKTKNVGVSFVLLMCQKD